MASVAHLVVTTFLASASSSPALDSGTLADAPRQGFSYCAPPQVPSCVRRQTTWNSAESTDACQAAERAYITSVFTYRACLVQEIERATTEANESANYARCRINRGKDCGTLP